VQSSAASTAQANKDLAAAHESMGLVRQRRGDQAAAQEQFAEAVRLLRPLAEEDPRSLQTQTAFMLALARHGDHVEAAAKAGELRKAVPTVGNLYNVACCYSLCVRTVSKGSISEEQSEAEQAWQKSYGDETIATLRQAAALGLKASDMATDSDLEAIRSHPDYPKLLQDIKEAAPGK
jgi:hypothetical protein